MATRPYIPACLVVLGLLSVIGTGPARATQSQDEASLDLGGSQFQTFMRVTVPLTMPGIISGYLLAFIISLDDFIITNFVKGAGMETLPTAIFGSAWWLRWPHQTVERFVGHLGSGQFELAAAMVAANASPCSCGTSNPCASSLAL